MKLISSDMFGNEQQKERELKQLQGEFIPAVLMTFMLLGDTFLILISKKIPAPGFISGSLCLFPG